MWNATDNKIFPVFLRSSLLMKAGVLVALLAATGAAPARQPPVANGRLLVEEFQNPPGLLDGNVRTTIPLKNVKAGKPAWFGFQFGSVQTIASVTLTTAGNRMIGDERLPADLDCRRTLARWPAWMDGNSPRPTSR